MHFVDRKAKYPNRWTMKKSDGTSEVVTLIRNDEPTVEGTPMNAETLNQLSDVAGADVARAQAEAAAQNAQEIVNNAEENINSFAEASSQKVQKDIDAKAAETLKTIPESYTELDGSVKQIEEEIKYSENDVPVYNSAIIQGGWSVDRNEYDVNSIRTITHPYALAKKDVKVVVNNGYKLYVYYYDVNGKNAIVATQNWTKNNYVIPAGKYYRVMIAKDDDSAITPLEAFENSKLLEQNTYSKKESIFDVTSFFEDNNILKGIFAYGNNTSSGKYDPSVSIRLSMIESISYNRPVIITIDYKNYVIFARYYEDSGKYLSTTEETRRLYIPENTKFRLSVERDPHNTNQIEINTPIEKESIQAIKYFFGGSSQSSVTRNPDAISNIIASKKHFDTTKINQFGTDNASNLLTIAHITDVHNDSTRYRNFCDFVDAQPNIDVAICTGDFVIYPRADEFSNILNTPHKKEIFVAIGNHEVSGGGYSKTTKELEEIFNIEKTYYKKEFPSKNIDLIVLNQYEDAQSHYTEEQINWLVEELENSASNNRHVVIAFHSPCTFPQKNDKGFYQRHRRWTDNFVAPIGRAIEDIIHAYTNSTAAEISFSNFTKNVDFSNYNGVFVAYMCGHYHGDYIGYSELYNDQLYLMCSCGACKPDTASYNYGEEVSDLPRIQGTKTEDCFNIYSIDTQNRIVKVVRVGSDVNDLMEDRKKAYFLY